MIPIKIFSLILATKEAPQHSFLRPKKEVVENEEESIFPFFSRNSQEPINNVLRAVSPHDPGGQAHLPPVKFPTDSRLKHIVRRGS